MANKEYTFYVKGMHCAACEYMLEDVFSSVKGVALVKASLGDNSVTVSGELPNDSAQFAAELTTLIAPHGYKILLAPSRTKVNYREFIVAFPAALTFLIAFFLLQKVGLVNLISSEEVTLGTAFVVGLIASVSTCLAVVGGLVLSISANAAKHGGHWQSQALFHVGRLGGFFVLGGVIGALGRVFQLGYMGSAALSIAVALVMFLLGLNLLEVFPFVQKLQLRVPKQFAKYASRFGASSRGVAPLLAGIATFFLPCGFTQSMQVYTLTTGSYVTGGLTMLAFALGTLPMLALLSFGSLEITHKPWKGTFFKATGIVVMVLALFNLWNGLVALGIAPPILSL
jgi:sulfite exporter TauE/SafE/copper chaperone CopZ